MKIAAAHGANVDGSTGPSGLYAPTAAGVKEEQDLTFHGGLDEIPIEDLDSFTPLIFEYQPQPEAAVMTQPSHENQGGSSAGVVLDSTAIALSACATKVMYYQGFLYWHYMEYHAHKALYLYAPF